MKLNEFTEFTFEHNTKVGFADEKGFSLFFALILVILIGFIAAVLMKLLGILAAVLGFLAVVIIMTFFVAIPDMMRYIRISSM